MDADELLETLPSMENGAVAGRVAADPPPRPLERGGGANPTPRADVVEWAPRPKERPAAAAAPTPRPRVWLGAAVAAAPKVADADPFFLRAAAAMDILSHRTPVRRGQGKPRHQRAECESWE
jgi:hypothetical protein